MAFTGFGFGGDLRSAAIGAGMTAAAFGCYKLFQKWSTQPTPQRPVRTRDVAVQTTPPPVHNVRSWLKNMFPDNLENLVKKLE